MSTLQLSCVGSYYCACKNGYLSVDDGYCEQVNECDLGYHSCNEMATCIDVPGSYTCKCNDGYYGDGFVCKKATCDMKCPKHSTCVTLRNGENKCQCNLGYSMADDQQG